ncbi:MAG: hypothetical protein LUE24_09145, partial [Lachnospiraceae bacterium]|nr:hypothetical protein [Lachnospiraceae bacterium]
QNQASVTVDGAAVSTNVVKTYVEEPSEETIVTVLSVQTGDDNHPFLWAIIADIAALGVCGFGGYAFWRRRKDR